METSGEMSKLPRKEESAIKREMGRMQRNFNGIVEMGGLVFGSLRHRRGSRGRSRSPRPPAAAFLPLPWVDTNSDPTLLTYPIPGNDDAVKSVRIIVETIVAAIQSGSGSCDNRAHGARGGESRCPGRG